MSFNDTSKSLVLLLVAKGISERICHPFSLYHRRPVAAISSLSALGSTN